jgi:hypothetical protein
MQNIPDDEAKRDIAIAIAMKVERVPIKAKLTERDQVFGIAAGRILSRLKLMGRRISKKPGADPHG